MISKFDKCLFVHIPKVAGQSIESVFLKRAGLNWEQRAPFLLRPNTNPKLGPPRLAHLTALEYIELGYLTEKEFAQMYRFSFVRNPWQRILSEYQYRDYKCTFEHFLLRSFPTKKNDNYISGDDLYRHIMPQANFLCDKQGQIMVDFIGRFETIGSDFSLLSERITGQKLVLPHKNKTKSTWWKTNSKMHYTEHFSDKAEQFVADYYAQDIELFGYKFGS